MGQPPISGLALFSSFGFACRTSRQSVPLAGNASTIIQLHRAGTRLDGVRRGDGRRKFRGDLHPRDGYRVRGGCGQCANECGGVRFWVSPSWFLSGFIFWFWETGKGTVKDLFDVGKGLIARGISASVLLHSIREAE